MQVESTNLKQDTNIRKFVGVAYSGKPILNHPHWGNLIFDLTNITSKPQIPILFNHDTNKIVGHGSISVSDKIVVQGKLSNSTPEGLMVQGLLDEGQDLQESVYIEPANIKKYSKGEKLNVNGQELIGPYTVFENSKIKEVSITPLGADENTTTLIFKEKFKETINIKSEGFHMENEELKTEEVEVKNEEVLEEPKAEEVEEVKEEEVKAEPAEELELKEEEAEEVSEEKKDITDKLKDAVKEGINSVLDKVKFAEANKILLESGIDEALKFACCGGCAEKTSKEDDIVAKLKEEINSLKSELAEYKKKKKKNKRFSLIEDLKEKTGVSFNEEAVNTLNALDENAFSEIIKGVSFAKKPVKTELFSDETKNDITFDDSTPATIEKSVSDYQKFMKETKNTEVSYRDALKQLMFS